MKCTDVLTGWGSVLATLILSGLAVGQSSQDRSSTMPRATNSTAMSSETPLSGSAAGQTVRGKEPPTAGGESTSAVDRGQEPETSFRPRLPKYYAQVVDDQQRQAIYAIQREYYPQIAALLIQLRELEAAQKREIESILTDAQRERLATLKQVPRDRGSGASMTLATE
ncbi:MAG: hypothetical protein KatS3mg111_0923 [Pirellulaceae bacterium]|nr:MAG: hypothetical protein KatS3mg111_0923 [Pirellulaceae bacterium]